MRPLCRRSFLVFGGFLASACGATSTRRYEFNDFIPLHLREPVRSGVSSADLTPFMRRALSEIDRVGGGELFVGDGVFSFDSVSLASVGLQLGTGTRLVGAGRSRSKFVITGSEPCRFLTGSDVSDVGIRNLTIIGNGRSLGEGSGAAFFLLSSSGAAFPTERIEISECHLENFSAPYWVHVENQNASDKAIYGISISGLTSKSRPGNSLRPEDITYASSVIGIRGYSNTVVNIRIRDVRIDASYIKSGISVYGNIADLVIERAVIENAGLFGAHDDSGAYAILLYGNGDLRDVLVRNVRIPRPRSCGIYVARGKNIVIEDIDVSGQSDRKTGTLPKGAIAFNWTVQPTVNRARFANNCFDVSLVARPESKIISARLQDIVSRSCLVTSIDIQIGPVAGEMGWRDILIKGCQLDSQGRGVMVQNSTTAHFDNLAIEGSRIQGRRCAVELNSGGGTKAANNIIRDTELSGGQNALLARSMLLGLTLERVTVNPPRGGSVALDLQGSRHLKLREISFLGFENPHMAVAADPEAIEGFRPVLVQ